jgi:hypothetical protein
MIRILEVPDLETSPTEVPVIETPEFSVEEKIDAYLRKEKVLREAQNELVNLEESLEETRREMNAYKKPIAAARGKISRLISCDISGFLKWEKEQELPLLQQAEAWRNESVDKLDVTAKDKEKLAEHFHTCGNVADWLGKDFPSKKPGLNGEKTKERRRDAIEKISGGANV